MAATLGFIAQFVRSQLFTTINDPTASFAGQNVIVTGSNTGLGKEAVRHLVRLGADKVILGVRNTSAGESAKADIEASTGRPGVCEVWSLDLSSFESVKAFAARAAKLPRLDAVIENAGMAAGKFEKAPEAGNHERTIAINVVSTFLLATLLVPILRASGRANPGSLPRLTIVSSDAHAMASFSEQDHDPIFAALSDPAKSNINDRYPTSKLIEIMAIRRMAPLLGGEDGTEVVLNTVNPGLCRSELIRDGPAVVLIGVKLMSMVFARSTETGGGILVSAAAGGRKTHGQYINDTVVWPTDKYNVTSEKGERTADKVWKELSAILQEIQPGVIDNLKG